ELYSVGLGAPNQIRDISRNRGGEDSDPVVSPDGQRIAFYSAHGDSAALYTADPDGKRRRQLTRLRLSRTTDDLATHGIAWSPNGRAPAFQGPAAVSVVSARGGDARTLGPGDSPSWSADGSRIAYTAWSRTGTGRSWVRVVTPRGRLLWR